ncbi:hypothetical protein [uncultured Friedmanniella sp.]|uniref:hypothetical protein n=1 Tax=uncultured Friedmanniella sp. TaxID=335381 RepID=UPI0035C9E195
MRALLAAPVFIIASSLVAVPDVAHGALTTGNNTVFVSEKGKKSTAGHPEKHSASTKTAAPKYRYLPKDEYKSQMKAYRAQLAAAIARNQQLQSSNALCVDRIEAAGCAIRRQDELPEAPDIRQAGDPAEPAQPALSPQEVAYIASARLTLTPPKPRIGPSPDLNRWKMAAVGYPLWLWADGNLDPAPVSDSVYDISVSLDARLVKVVFDMGDGNKLTCTNLSTQWTPSVKPGTASPSCGYRYQKPSLPAGSYTVTANAVWAVDWNITGTTGTIPFYQSASTTIPVGELQVLVR